MAVALKKAKEAEVNTNEVEVEVPNVDGAEVNETEVENETSNVEDEKVEEPEVTVEVPEVEIPEPKVEEPKVEVDTKSAEVNLQNKPNGKVKIRMRVDHRCTIAMERYDLKAGKTYVVPENVKRILNKAGLLAPL